MLLVALPARPDAKEQTADSRLLRDPVPALADVVIPSAIVLWSTGRRLGIPILELLIQRVTSRQQMCQFYRQRIQGHCDPATFIAGVSRLAESTRLSALRAQTWRSATSACHGSASCAASFVNPLPLS